MEKDNLYDDLMMKMLEGDVTQAEVFQFQNWLKQSPDNEQIYADFQKIWTATPDIQLLNKLNIEEDLVRVKAGHTSLKSFSNTRVISLSFIRKIAAILLPLIVAMTGLYFYFNQIDNKTPILLSDGTKVWLYKDAKLDYPASFEGNNRIVKLTGEAFFDVAKNKDKPFIIEAGITNIEVLGTSFNVQSRIQETNVIVNTGVVRLTAKNDGLKSIELTKGEKGIYKEGTLIETINADVNYRSWQNGIFEFDGTKPFKEVIEQLAKYYGPLNIKMKGREKCLLEANFEKEELGTVLDVIKNSCALEF